MLLRWMASGEKIQFLPRSKGQKIMSKAIISIRNVADTIRSVLHSDPEGDIKWRRKSILISITIFRLALRVGIYYRI